MGEKRLDYGTDYDILLYSTVDADNNEGFRTRDKSAFQFLQRRAS